MRYNKKIQWMLLLGLIMAGQASLQVCAQEKVTTSEIQFIPKEFNDIKLGYGETEMVKTSPGYPNDVIKANTMVINTPKVIYYNDCDSSFRPTIPLSATYNLSLNRLWKYIDLVAQLIHVKHIESGVEVSGEICEKKVYPNLSVFPAEDPMGEKWEEEQIKEAQKLTDAELDNGQCFHGCLNVNIMEYLDFSFLPGKYKVWLSFSGLESNHTMVEIVKRGNEK